MNWWISRWLGYQSTELIKRYSFSRNLFSKHQLSQFTLSKPSKSRSLQKSRCLYLTHYYNNAKKQKWHWTTFYAFWKLKFLFKKIRENQRFYQEHWLKQCATTSDFARPNNHSKTVQHIQPHNEIRINWWTMHTIFLLHPLKL